MEIDENKYIELDHLIQHLGDCTKCMLCHFGSGSRDLAMLYAGKISMAVELLDEKWKGIESDDNPYHNHIRDEK